MKMWIGTRYNPYDTTVYDDKHRRKTLMKHLRRLRTEPRQARKKYMEELKKNGVIDNL